MYKTCEYGIVKVNEDGTFSDYIEGENWSAYSDWLKDGNKAQPMTEEELGIIDLKLQRAECQKLLDDSDKKIVSDTPYPDDIPAWTEVRTQWRTIIKSNQIETIPEPPF